MTINLRAPVIINKKKNWVKQIVLAEGKYQTRHNVLAEMQRSAFDQKKQKEKLKRQYNFHLLSKEGHINACSYQKD